MAFRIAPSIYREVINGLVFEIDGQNGLEYGTREWIVSKVIKGSYNEELVWIGTYSSKKSALEDRMTWSK